MPKSARPLMLDRKKEILEAAAQVFAEQGYKGATTKLLADRAAVSEALIYRYFTSKKHLFREVIRFLGGDERSGAAPKAEMQQLDDAQFFESLGHRLYKRFAEEPSRLRLLLFASLQGHELASEFFKLQMANHYQALIERLEEGQRRGLFRSFSAPLAARAFVGMIHYHVMIQVLFEEDPIVPLKGETSRFFAELFLSGIQKGVTH